MTVAERATCSWENESRKFSLVNRTCKAQYAQMYFARLMELSVPVKKQAQQKWPQLAIQKLLTLEDKVEQVAVGTIYKDMKLKPTVLKEYTENRTMAAQLGADAFTAGTDSLILEDESARIKLTGELDVATLATGVVIAVRGVYDARDGSMHVTEHTFAGVPMQPPRPELTSDKWVAVASGLCVGDPAVDAPRLMLLVDWLKGMLGDVELCQQVCRLIICGGTLGSAQALATAAPASRQQRFAMEAVQEVDRCCTELASALPVDLMPGRGDLANHSLPQQPLHRCLFPGAGPYESFTRVTNPYQCSLDGVKLLGTSGQNVADVQRYTDGTTSQSIMQDNLRQRHLCCTAPDTLACFPFVSNDPFILSECPHVYFVGNQASFSAETMRGESGQEALTVAVPAFARTGTIVLLNLRTLEAKPMTFDATL